MMLARTMPTPHLALSLAGCMFLWCAPGLAQEPSTAPQLSSVREFPVIMRQSVTAGRTPVGTKVQAKLAVATLLDGQVIPRNAVFSGEVIVSVAKTANIDSRLSIRMDSAHWKNESASVMIYLTPWYYPTRNQMGQDLQYGPSQPASRTWNGAGAYPDPHSKIYKPFPEGDTDKGGSVPDTPSSSISNHRAPIPEMHSERDPLGGIALVSHSAIKLDKLTTYVLATGDLSASAAK